MLREKEQNYPHWASKWICTWIIFLTREYFSKTFRLEQISDIMSIVCRYQLYLLFITQLYLALGSKNFIDLPHRWNLNGRNIFNQRYWIANRVALIYLMIQLQLKNTTMVLRSKAIGYEKVLPLIFHWWVEWKYSTSGNLFYPKYSEAVDEKYKTHLQNKPHLGIGTKLEFSEHALYVKNESSMNWIYSLKHSQFALEVPLSARTVLQDHTKLLSVGMA